MPSAKPVEHFVTLFDRHFLPAGLALLASLRTHCPAFHLWIVCMDEEVERRLREMALAEVSLLPLREVENEALLAVKPGRAFHEYCWTLTPFTAAMVMQRQPDVARVTYLDADLFFFADPALILDEFTASGAHVLISEHAYARGYDQSRRAGIYCVQFMVFRNTAQGRAVMAWWQARCLEWCYARVEEGKFGDQKYLDDWPQRFAGDVYVLQQRHLAQGPWNVQRFFDKGSDLPVFFHFHSLRIVDQHRIRLYWGYRIGAAGQTLYAAYLDVLRPILARIRAQYGQLPVLPEPATPRHALIRGVLRVLGAVRYVAAEEGACSPR